MSELLIKNLQNPAFYEHPVHYIKLIETHVSWIILTGLYAYKVKKPLNLGFLDYSTLEKRYFYCQEEVRLNRLLAPEFYLGVVAITNSAENPKIQENGENFANTAIEYAVKMREFPQSSLFTTLLESNQLSEKMIDALAETVANFHQTTPIAHETSSFGTPEHTHAPVRQNFEQILPLLNKADLKKDYLALQAWSEQQYAQHYALLVERKKSGFVRDCHGDLHLRNIILYHEKPLLFDRIEFNDDFRWTDVLADISFLLMDLDDHQKFSFSRRLLSRYSFYTGDYESLSLLPYYQTYRAIVRARVALFRKHQAGLSSEEALKIEQQFQALTRLAKTYTHKKQPMLLITHGFSGSGKFVLSSIVAETLGAIWIASDVERKRLAHLSLLAKTFTDLDQGIYSPEDTIKTYARLAYLAERILQAGYPVIVDATFLKASQRETFKKLAQSLNIPFFILHRKAKRTQLEAWIIERQAEGKNPSEANLQVLALQEATLEPLSVLEAPNVISFEMDQWDQKQGIEIIQKALMPMMNA